MTIDIEKMKALAAKLRSMPKAYDVELPTAVEAATAIDSLLSELEAARNEVESLTTTVARCRDEACVEGYAEAFLQAAIGNPDDVPAFVSQTIIELLGELETRELDRLDARRYRFIKRERLILSGGSNLGWPISPYGDR